MDVSNIDITTVFTQITLFMSQVFTFMQDTFIILGEHRFSLFDIGLGALAVAEIVKNLLPMFDGEGEYELDEDVDEYFNG